jgi:hypothetical protein
MAFVDDIKEINDSPPINLIEPLNINQLDQLVIFHLDNISHIYDEKPFIAYSGKNKTTESATQYVIKKLTDMRCDRLNRPLVDGEHPVVSILCCMGHDAATPKNKQLWTYIKKIYARSLRFKQGQPSMFSLRGWSLREFKLAIVSANGIKNFQ